MARYRLLRVAKLILMSAILVAMIVPVFAARTRSPKRGLFRTVVGLVLFNVVYAFLLINVYRKICWD